MLIHSYNNLVAPRSRGADNLLVQTSPIRDLLVFNQSNLKSEWGNTHLSLPSLDIITVKQSADELVLDRGQSEMETPCLWLFILYYFRLFIWLFIT